MNTLVCETRLLGKTMLFEEVAKQLEKKGNIKVYIIENGLVADITKFPTSKTILSTYGLRKVSKVCYKNYKLCDEPDEKVARVYLLKEAK